MDKTLVKSVGYSAAKEYEVLGIEYLHNYLEPEALRRGTDPQTP